MQTKLTLRMDHKLIRRAKSHAKRRGQSVSQVVADYFSLLDKVEEQPQQEREIFPIVHSLRGLLKGSGLDERDYKRYLEDKYL